MYPRKSFRSVSDQFKSSVRILSRERVASIPHRIQPVWNREPVVPRDRRFHVYPQYHARPMFIHETRLLCEFTGAERYQQAYEHLVNHNKPGINTCCETHPQVFERTGDPLISDKSSARVPTTYRDKMFVL